MSLRKDILQSTVGQFANQFAGRIGDPTYDNKKLYRNHKRNRAYVWNPAMQEKLIDSMLKNYPLPMFLCSSRIVNGEEIREILDGGNRTTTFQRILREEVRLLTPEERQIIMNFPITITVMYNLTSKDIREIFRRFNKGVKVSDGQLYAMAEEDSVIVCEAIALLQHSDHPLREVITETFFDTRCKDTKGMTNLENAVALVSGALNGPNYITKSYNVQEEMLEKQDPIDRDAVVRVLKPVFDTFVLANTYVELLDKRKRRAQWPIGRLLGPILYEILMWPDEIPATQEKWALYIAALRREDGQAKEAIHLLGAQNLTATRHRRIAAKVTIFMKEKRIATDDELSSIVHPKTVEEDTDDDDEDEVLSLVDE
jgi:hypothetical protein